MRKNVPLLLILILAVIGCAGGDSRNPAVPTLPSDSSQASIGNRHLWGLWDVYLGADHQTVEVVPMRIAGMHLNTVRLLEVTPCKDCLKISNVTVVELNVIEADVTLTHPYPGLLKYTGFDVRGIFVSEGDYTFPVSGRKIAWGDSVPRMLNPDGYTELFNPTEYLPTKPAALGYIQGKMATGGDLSATLNPFVAYREDAPRRMFESGGSETRTVRIYTPTGPIHFGYAVDACWHPVAQVIDPLKDFPPEANCLEAYRMDVSISAGLTSEVGSQVPIQVEIYDHQGQETISSVTMEAPDLFLGDLALTFSCVSPSEAFMFSGTLPNDFGAADGEYPLLVMARDTGTDPNLGDIAAWQVSRARVEPPRGWARTWGGTQDDQGYSVAVDDQGNAYAVGEFGGTVDFDPSPVAVDPHTSNGGLDVFLAKYDNSGSFLWAKTWGGTENDPGYGVALDSTGGVFVTGGFRSTVDFDPGSLVDNHTSNGLEDAFLSKFDTNGNFKWARTWGISGDDDGGSPCATDDAGNVYVPSFFGGNLRKFDTNGNQLWYISCGVSWWSEVEVDSSGNIILPGRFSGTVDFDPGPGTDLHTSNGNWDACLTKLDSSGAYQWARTWGGSDWDTAYAASFDSAGGVYAAGWFRGIVDFDPGLIVFNVTSEGGADAFISKFTSGGSFSWCRTWGGVGDDNASSLTVDANDNLCTAGSFSDDVDFFPEGSGDHRTSKGADDIFVLMRDINGGYQWAQTWGSPGIDGGIGLSFHTNGDICVTGAFNGTIDFDPGSGDDQHTSNGMADVFLMKLMPNGYW